MTSSRILLGALLMLIQAFTACSGTSGSGARTEGPAIVDGQELALVIVGLNEEGALTVGVDPVEALHGERARQAAIDDGVIDAGDELINDFYIHNPEASYQLLQFGEEPAISMIPAQSVDATTPVTPEELARLWRGAHAGQDGFYVAPFKPIPMMIVVSNGRIVEATEIYLPRRQPQSS